jgi:hypothetical protein
MAVGVRSVLDERGMPSTYPPLNTFKPVAENIWIVDGPIIRFGMPWPKMPFPTRMTVIRIGDGDLFIHSPTPLSSSLKDEVDAIGRPRWIIGPSRFHYWWIPEWRSAFPGAAVYLAPRVVEQARGRIDFKTEALDADTGYPWDIDIATLRVTGRILTEVDFFHRPSHTLIVTDLIENFEPQKLESVLMRWLTRLGRVLDPDGQMPYDMRLTFRRPRLKAAVETMISWEPERIILAHGRWYQSDGARELRRAFRWLLRDDRTKASGDA